MNCFASLVDNNFLKKATKELNQARRLIYATQEPSNQTQTKTKSNMISWTFIKSKKRREFDHVWKLFEMDKYIHESSEFLVRDYISVVEDNDVSFLCSPTKHLVDESIKHYYYVYGDWCFHRTKKRIGRSYVHVALMWKAFPTSPFPVN